MKKILLKAVSTLMLIAFIVVGLSNPENTDSYEILFQIGLGFVALKVSFYAAMYSHKIESLLRVNLLKVQ